MANKTEKKKKKCHLAYNSKPQSIISVLWSCTIIRLGLLGRCGCSTYAMKFSWTWSILLKKKKKRKIQAYCIVKSQIGVENIILSAFLFFSFFISMPEFDFNWNLWDFEIINLISLKLFDVCSKVSLLPHIQSLYCIGYKRRNWYIQYLVTCTYSWYYSWYSLMGIVKNILHHFESFS